MRRRVVMLIGIAILAAGALTLVYLGRAKFSPPNPPADNAYVGMTKREIEARLGNPASRIAGHYGLPSRDWTSQHPDCETIIYDKWSGTLYLTVERQNGEWVGLRSKWVPKGTEF